jgi:type II secretory pathway pseudopilin PulG
MKVSGQVASACTREQGYAMAVLLVAISVAAVMMTVAMPVWKQMAQREKEEELIFRGQQYVRALRLFGAKYANASPPNIDVLVDQRFLRKKFKDPITNDDFQPLLAGQATPGSSTNAQAGTQRGARGGADGRGAPSPGAGPATPSVAGGASSTGSPFGRGISTGGTSPIGTPGAGTTGGIIGVTSKSKDKSIRLYNGRNHYNEWAFINTPQTQAPGAGGVGAGQRGGPQRGGPGTPGQPGANPFGAPGPLGGQRGRGTGTAPGPGRGFNPGGSPTFPSPFPPPQPPPGGRGRGGF